ncbi:hypothetical protein THAOC_14466, partial [Thalassiosira oceanica]
GRHSDPKPGKGVVGSSAIARAEMVKELVKLKKAARRSNCDQMFDQFCDGQTPDREIFDQPNLLNYGRVSFLATCAVLNVIFVVAYLTTDYSAETTDYLGIGPSSVRGAAQPKQPTPTLEYDISDGVVDVVPGDPRCILVIDEESSKLDDLERQYEGNTELGVGDAESYSLGPCLYYYPKRNKPELGYIKDIDWFHFRTSKPTVEARDSCFVKCLDLMEELPITSKLDPGILSAASWMGLAGASRKLLHKFNVDPLYRPEVTQRDLERDDSIRLRRNAMQAAISGGYTDIVKILSKGDYTKEIDEWGRTVEDYVRMVGSPIRPHFAKSILGIHVQDQVPRTGIFDAELAGESEWNRTESEPFDDFSCEFDVIDSEIEDLPYEEFLRDYYLPGRPVVLRNHVSTYPPLSMQKHCSHQMSIEQLERNERCEDNPKLHMMHAENFDEVFGIYDGDPLRGGFRKIKEWFDLKQGWQIFFGSDGSGATLHWHAAAFNILYVGVKEWHITPPLYRGFSGMTAQSVKKRIADEPHSMKCTQMPGDLIYIPAESGALTMKDVACPFWTRERCSGRQRGLSCSAECPLYAEGFIWSVHGLRRPQTTIDAPTMPTIIDLSAPMCARLKCDWAVFDFCTAFSTPKQESSQIGHMTPLDKPLLQCRHLPDLRTSNSSDVGRAV